MFGLGYTVNCLRDVDFWGGSLNTGFLEKEIVGGDVAGVFLVLVDVGSVNEATKNFWLENLEDYPP